MRKRLLITLKWLNSQNAVSGVFVTILGVWAAFWLTDLGGQRQVNDATRQRLQLVHFEAEQNAILAQAIFLNESVTNRIDVILKRPHAVALRAVLRDDNLPVLLPHAKLSMLLTYLDSIEALQHTLDIHANHLISLDFEHDHDRAFLRQAIREKAATALAASFAVMFDLDVYAEPGDWDPMPGESNQQRIDRLRAMALDGRLIMSDDPRLRHDMKKIIQQRPEHDK